MTDDAHSPVWPLVASPLGLRRLPVPGRGDLAVRWYLRYGLSHRDVEELLAERGIEVDRVTVYRWVHRFTPLLVDAAGPARAGRRLVRRRDLRQVNGVWRYVYRAIDQHGQVVDVLLSARRDTAAPAGSSLERCARSG